MYTIPLQILPLEQEGFHILVEVKILDATHKMVVDTGASKTVFDKEMLLTVGVDESDFISSELLSTGLGTNEMKSEILKVKNLHIGEWQCGPIEVAILDLSTINHAYTQMNLPPIIGVIGGDILLYYGGIINYKKARLTLNKSRRKVKL